MDRKKRALLATSGAPRSRSRHDLALFLSNAPLDTPWQALEHLLPCRQLTAEALADIIGKRHDLRRKAKESHARRSKVAPSGSMTK